jgi:hypothetical protein
MRGEEVISKDKKYRTRDGREVRIYATDAGPRYPIHGAFLLDGEWLHESWTIDGENVIEANSPSDLVEVKPRIQRVAWLNVYPEAACLYYSRAMADQAAFDLRLACVKITIDCEEGEGL